MWIAQQSGTLTNWAKEGMLVVDISIAMESARHSTLVNVSRTTLVGVVVVVLVRVGAP
jgi:hypothetical protein